MVNRIVLNTVSYHGKGAIAEIPGIAKREGFAKVFVCSDPSLVKFGVTAKVTDLLEANGIAYTLYSNIKPNPQLPIPMDVKYTVMGFEKVGGEECVKLQSEVTSAQGSAGSINLDVKANGNIWFAYKKGIMIKNEVTSNMVMLMENDLGGGKKETIETRMNLSLTMGLTK